MLLNLLDFQSSGRAPNISIVSGTIFESTSDKDSLKSTPSHRKSKSRIYKPRLSLKMPSANIARLFVASRYICTLFWPLNNHCEGVLDYGDNEPLRVHYIYLRCNKVGVFSTDNLSPTSFARNNNDTQEMTIYLRVSLF